MNGPNYIHMGRILTANQNFVNYSNGKPSFDISPFPIQNEIFHIYLVGISLNSTDNKPTASALLVERWKQLVLSE